MLGIKQFSVKNQPETFIFLSKISQKKRHRFVEHGFYAKKIMPP